MDQLEQEQLEKPTVEQLKNPDFYELTATLHEDGLEIYSANYALPAGTVIPAIPEHDNQHSQPPISLVRSTLISQFHALPEEVYAVKSGTVDAVKLAWEFIKDGKPESSAQGASTAVLAASDMAWEHYAAAKNFASKTFQYRVKNKLGMKIIKADYKVRGTYLAQYTGKSSQVPEGDYMPNIEVYCSKIRVSWGFSLNAEAVLSHISNIGEVGGKVIPSFNATLIFNPSSWLSNHTDTFAYKLTGSNGYKGKA